MLNKLKSRWGVNGLGLVLVLCTFAIGGSLSGYLGRAIMAWMEIEGGWYYVPLYIVLVTLLWPLCVISVSVFTGQFSFFSKYLHKMGVRMGLFSTSASPSSKQGA